MKLNAFVGSLILFSLVMVSSGCASTPINYTNDDVIETYACTGDYNCRGYSFDESFLDLCRKCHRIYSAHEFLSLNNRVIENFSFLVEHPNISHLFIRDGIILSFDYFAEKLNNLRHLEIHRTEICENLGAIPYIDSLFRMTINHENALNLIQNNSHIRGHLDIGLSEYCPEDIGNLYVSLDCLKPFSNISIFSYRGYTTRLDISALQNTNSLFYINIYRGVYSVYGIGCLADLPSLVLFGLPL